MKKYLVILLAGLSLFFASCASKGDIDDLQSQIDGLKSGQIASIESQISSINTSISALQETDREIKGYITTLQNTASELQKSINTANGKIDDLQKALTLVNSAIETLQAKDSALEKRIDDLKEYVDTQLKNAKDWVSATFATLEQYNGIVSEIGGLRGSISSINTAMEQMESRLDGKITSMKGEIESAYTKAMGTLETSLKNWVNDQLKGYWTIAETEAKLAALKGSLEKEDESFREDIDKLSTSLDSAKTELTEGYKAAIKKAIDENKGVIDGEISEAVSGLNTRIDSEVSTINKRIGDLEQRVSRIEQYLLSRIQSLSYIPRYDDGASTMWLKKKSDGSVQAMDTLDFRVSPADCADALVEVWESAVSAEAVNVLTRGTQETISLPILSVTGGNGKVSVVLDGSSLGKAFFNGKQKMKAVVVISDGNNELTSDYISMVAKDAEGLIINQTSCEVSPEGGPIEFEVKSNVDYNVKSSVDWIKSKQSQGSSSPTIPLVIEANNNSNYRTGSVTFSQKGGGESVTITIKQRPLPKVETFAASNVGLFTGRINGGVTVESASSIVQEVWFYYSDKYNTLEGLRTMGEMVKVTMDNNGNFSYSLQELDYNTQYYYVSCAKLFDTDYFGVIKSFVTEDIVATSTTKEAYDVSISRASLLGNLTLKTSITPTEVGFYYGTSSDLEELKRTGTKLVSSTVNGGDFYSSIIGLNEETVYYYVAYSIVYDKTFWGDVESFTTKELPAGAVNLGLSVCWAECNMGATSPEGYGEYYAWGEVSTKTNYSSHDKWWEENIGYTKYCIHSYYGIVDNKKVLEPDDDVAHVILGGSWRMPIADEFNELVRKCTQTKKTINGVPGILFTGPSGKSIFLPLSGYFIDRIYYKGQEVRYWSSSLSVFGYGEWTRSDFAHILSINKSYYSAVLSTTRSSGLPVRAIVE